jgi:outer membrane lipoprotein-sorting protein
MPTMLLIGRDFLSYWPATAVILLWLVATSPAAIAQEAAEIIKSAVDYWRDVSSYSVSDMVIHRPDWERRVTMRIWTRGEKQSLVRVVAPPRDAGNATLLVDNDMWTFTPKINRVIKIPSSMMNQSWMGSDFSNNDLARADDLIEQYTHSLLRTEAIAGRRAWVIESVPKEAAPVVWGKEVVTVRDDYVVLAHAFYDQQGVLVKLLSTQELKTMGGKTVAARQRMQRTDKADEWTEVVVREARFGIDVPDSFFTTAHLRNPRE